MQVGLPPRRVDVLTAISGVESFAAAWSERVERLVGSRRIPFIGRATLLANTRASGRLEDLADVEALAGS